MNLKGMLAFLALALVAGAPGLAAQDLTAPAPDSILSLLTVGNRVRVTSALLGSHVPGTILSLADGALTLAPDDQGPLKIPASSILRIEARTGRKSNAVKGLLIGSAIGVGLGLLLPTDANDCGDRSSNFCSRGQAVAGGALTGGLIGVIAGALNHRETWTPIVFPPRGNASSRTRGVRVAFTVRL